MNQSDIINFENMRNIDIRAVDQNMLTDIRDINIDTEKPLTERMFDYLKQIHNPYCFRYGKITVNIEFTKTEITMEECMEGYFSSL